MSGRHYCIASRARNLNPSVLIFDFRLLISDFQEKRATRIAHNIPRTAAQTTSDK